MAENLNAGLQRAILKLLILEDNFISMVSGDLKIEYFSSLISRKIARICLDYFAVFKEAPKQHFNDELISSLSELSEEDKQDYVDFIKTLEKLNPNTDYVLSRISTFVQQRAFENSAIKFAEFSANGEFEQAKSLMYDTLKAGIYERDEPFEYGIDETYLEKRGEKETYLMTTGITAWDNLIGGYKRGEVICTMGGYKGKKTWDLIHKAKTAVTQGLNVIYFTHEVSVDEIDKRLDMMLSLRASENKYINTIVEAPFYEPQKKEIYIQPFKARYVYKDFDIIREKRKQFLSGGGCLHIKKYPMKTCSVDQMDNYIDYVEQYHDFIPDVIITDYLTIMNISEYSKETRHQIDGGYTNLKRIADERQVILFTASQVTTGALSKESIHMEDLAEDKRIAGNVDLLEAVSGTLEQDKAGISRKTLVATRTRGSMGEYCMFSHCIPLGQFALSSWFGNELTREAFAAFGED